MSKINHAQKSNRRSPESLTVPSQEDLLYGSIGADLRGPVERSVG